MTRIYFTEDIQEQLKKLDYKIEDKEKRLEITNDILSSPAVVSFCEEYGTNKVSAFLEILANYLCGGKMKEKPCGVRPRKIEKIDDIVKRADECQVIADYAQYRDHLRWLRAQPEAENQKVVLDSILGTVYDDLRVANDACFPKVQTGAETHTHYVPDYTACDYTDWRQVRAIIIMPRYPIGHPCYYIREDINDLVMKNKDAFSKRELDVVSSYYIYGGRSTSMVAQLLNIDRANTYRTLRVVAKKIVELEVSNYQRH